MPTGYISNNYSNPYQLQRQQDASFGMQTPRTSPQFSGMMTQQTIENPAHEPSLTEVLTTPFALAFLPLTLMDHNVQKSIQESSQKYGVTPGLDQNKKLFGKFAYRPKFEGTATADYGARTSNLGRDLKSLDYKGMFDRSVIEPRQETLYKSLAKEGRNSKEIFDIVHGNKGLTATEEASKLAKIGEATKKIKVSNGVLNGVRGAMGVGKAAKFFRSIPVVSTLLFSFGEIFNVASSVKYGAGETAKQVARSSVSVAANIVAFEAGTSIGASIGATIGTAICPGVGSVIGGVVGGFVGGIVASHFAEKAASAVTESVLGKPKYKEAEEQEALAQQTQVQQESAPPQQEVAQQPVVQQPYCPAPQISVGGDINQVYSMYKMVA